eukprot:gb/GECH01012090.1/.p1 GENE.gb/GECH01012090.1/~~gb/GECH01012090.1/.p1  ORF type:complete len:140 (+),score=37.16 gb/GECH01012090.1/:1-420(+)
MKLFRVLILVFCLFSLTATSLAGKYDNVEKLRVGIKHRPQSCERKTKPGDNIKVHYRGTLTDGTEFDSSYKRDSPLSFRLGSGQVIKGWDQGMVGACIGEKRKLVVPYDLAYGERGMPPTIPEKATLIFESEIVDIENE